MGRILLYFKILDQNCCGLYLSFNKEWEIELDTKELFIWEEGGLEETA